MIRGKRGLIYRLSLTTEGSKTWGRLIHRIGVLNVLPQHTQKERKKKKPHTEREANTPNREGYVRR